MRLLSPKRNETLSPRPGRFDPRRRRTRRAPHRPGNHVALSGGRRWPRLLAWQDGRLVGVGAYQARAQVRAAGPRAAPVGHPATSRAGSGSSAASGAVMAWWLLRWASKRRRAFGRLTEVDPPRPAGVRSCSTARRGPQAPRRLWLLGRLPLLPRQPRDVRQKRAHVARVQGRAAAGRPTGRPPCKPSAPILEATPWRRAGCAPRAGSATASCAARSPSTALVDTGVRGRDARCRSFPARPLADGFLTSLHDAVRDRRPFNPDTGLPAAGDQAAAGAVSWYEHARAYTEAKWPHLAPTSRRSASARRWPCWSLGRHQHRRDHRSVHHRPRPPPRPRLSWRCCSPVPGPSARWR